MDHWDEPVENLALDTVVLPLEAVAEPVVDLGVAGKQAGIVVVPEKNSISIIQSFV